MYQLYHNVIDLPLAEYIASYRDCDRFMTYCRACRNYGRRWSCPPFDFDPQEILQRYPHIWIIGTRIDLDDTELTPCSSSLERIERCRKIIGSVRSTLDRQLLQLEEIYPGSLCLPAGSCFGCPEGDCARVRNEACIRPQGARHSLESFGFDLALTASQLLGIELKWSYDEQMPPYLTLVSGLLTPSTEGPRNFPNEICKPTCP